jgi:hypothetical protein
MLGKIDPFEEEDMASRPVNYATPTATRAISSYPARRGHKPGVIDPSDQRVVGVEGAIDIHCHAHDGQQDPFGVAKLASLSGMRGLLYKTIVGRKNPARTVAKVQADLDRWCAERGVTPITCWAGISVTEGQTVPISAAYCRGQLDDGVVALWMPNVNAANTLNIVGGQPIRWDPTAKPSDHTDPLPWEEALKYGQYLLDDKGKLKKDIEEIFRISADRGTAVFFGHPTKPEFWAMAELCAKIGMKRGVVDHPFSPFVNLSIEEMVQAAAAGLWLNFTYDEISPLLGIDPARMYEAIRTIGPQHCTLSSDCGEPLFPNSVEGMRMLLGYMKAFGCSAEEIRRMACDNPAFIVGLKKEQKAQAAE